MQIAIIKSLIHHKPLGPNILGEEGYYELEVEVDMSLAEGDPRGYASHQLAKHIAACSQRTDIPVGEKLWYVQFSPWAQEHLRYPAEAFF